MNKVTVETLQKANDLRKRIMNLDSILQKITWLSAKDYTKRLSDSNNDNGIDLPKELANVFVKLAGDHFKNKLKMEEKI